MANPTEREGVHYCGIEAARMKWMFREQPIDDVGIDAHMELTDEYNGPRELDQGIKKIREHGIMRLTKGRSANHVIQNVHVEIQGEGSH